MIFSNLINVSIVLASPKKVKEVISECETILVTMCEVELCMQVSQTHLIQIESEGTCAYYACAGDSEVLKNWILRCRTDYEHNILKPVTQLIPTYSKVLHVNLL